MPSNKVKFTFESTFLVFGIISETPIYALASELNKKIGYSLAWTKDYIVDNAKERQSYSFHNFTQKNEDKELEILLISNIYQDHFLFKKYNDFHSFLIFNSPELVKLEEIKALNPVMLIKEIFIKDLKGIEVIWEMSNFQ